MGSDPRAVGDLFVADPVTVPANTSRHFRSAAEARAQPTALLHLAWDVEDPFLFNGAFDPSLIRHDEAYCTTVRDLSGALQLPTLEHIDRVRDFVSRPLVVDIGCGQGEFVQALRTRGIETRGYDPVLRAPAPGLYNRYWEPGDDAEAGLFVTRCVLPHISGPWKWVEDMGIHHPEALLLIEFQRLSWMVERGLWYQLAHDHVNQFTSKDFHERFEVLDEGLFAHDEWAWVLIRPSSYRKVQPRECDVRDDLARLTLARRLAIDSLRGRRLVLWGAAGKGITLAHALVQAGIEVSFAVDADPARQHKFMEGSGARVLTPEELLDTVSDQLLVVCNPNHLTQVQQFVGASVEAVTLGAAGVTA